MLFSDRELSTITISGYFRDIIPFKENELMPYLALKFGITGIRSTAGYIYKDGFKDIDKGMVRIKKNARKKKVNQMRSQITFKVPNSKENHYYKIKVFRNGNFQVMGVTDITLTDIRSALKILEKYLRYYINPEVYYEITDISRINYKYELINSLIDLKKLNDRLNDLSKEDFPYPSIINFKKSHKCLLKFIINDDIKPSIKADLSIYRSKINLGSRPIIPGTVNVKNNDIKHINKIHEWINSILIDNEKYVTINSNRIHAVKMTKDDVDDFKPYNPDYD